MTSKTVERVSFLEWVSKFMGYLAGSGKALNTQKNYKWDLEAFTEFLVKEFRSIDRVDLRKITLRDLDRYADYLSSKSFSKNSQRRKLMTVRKFLSFAGARKLPELTRMGKKLATPLKLEKTPHILRWSALLEKIDEMPKDTPLHTRNRLLLWLMTETGCLVSEVGKAELGAPYSVRFLGKRGREVPVSKALWSELKEWGNDKGEALFEGFNRYGPASERLSARGVELLVKSSREYFQEPKLTPRIFRHSLIYHWLSDGKSKEEIKEWIGLKSEYPFRAFEAFFPKKN